MNSSTSSQQISTRPNSESILEEVRRLLDDVALSSDGNSPDLNERIAVHGRGLIDELLKLKSELQFAQATLPPPPVVEQAQHVRATPPIDLSKAVIITKESKIEYEMRTEGKSFAEVESRLRATGEALNGRIESHKRHVERKSELERYFSPEQFVTLSEDNRDKIRQASIVFSWGGDDHLSAVAQYVDGATPVIGINSDPEKSFGALLEHTHDQLGGILLSLERGEYRFEPWTRLSVELNGKQLAPALGLVMVAEEKRKYLSRNLFRIQGRPESTPEGRDCEQKSSGLLISTGVGSTSWYHGASQYLYPKGDIFPRTSRVARYVLTEPSYTVLRSDGSKGASEVVHGTIFEGEEIELKSLNKDRGIISVDSVADYPFPAGSVAKVAIDREPLWLVKAF